VFGLGRPTLLWPRGLSGRLTDAELEAIVAHELRHVVRRDTLSALLHTIVETLFWFHPLAWWIGARLTSERERACDEEVIGMGIDNRHYADAVVKVSRFCLRVPAAVMAGIGGSPLAVRIERILSAAPKTPPRLTTRLLLVGVLAIGVAAPMAAGASARIGVDRGQAPQSSESRVVRPRLIHEVKPEYTQEAMEARIQGSLQLGVVVLRSGDVGEVTVERSLDRQYGLDDQAVKAVKQWRFEPGTLDGEPEVTGRWRSRRGKGVG
jgi:TonB family protein